MADLSKRGRGRWGEDLAARHYQHRGATVLDRNWRCPLGELDLVVDDHGTYVFVEVKARRSEAYGPAAAAVGPEKQRRIRQLAIEWLRANEVPFVDLRFDVVAVTGVRVDCIEAAF
jgi:putative endonuclease